MQKTAKSKTHLVCNLTTDNVFDACNDLVLAAFGGDCVHTYQLTGSWNLEKAAKENVDALVRSIRKIPKDNNSIEWNSVTFQFGQRAFVHIYARGIAAFASTLTEAERLATRFGKKYSQPPKPSGGAFNLITVSFGNIQCESVTLPPATILAPEIFDLHYGDDSREWHKDFVEKLHHQSSGLSIFEGRPGTGKTYYLRHLMGMLKESHRFYFIPTSALGILCEPQFIGFWIDQQRVYADRKFVVIIEDADAALMTRGADNRELVSAILNLSDGMLADFLKLQIICTINCSAGDIDQALLRPGRLVCHRIFGRLHYEAALRLAESLGKKLPVPGDYSLAEVFSGNEKNEIKRAPIGFGA